MELFRGRWRRRAVLAVPVAVPVTMTVLFEALAGKLSPRAAYNAGFAAYWGIWCLGVPMVLVGPKRIARVLTSGRRLTTPELALSAVPVLGAVGTQLVPHRRDVDPAVAAVMIASAAVNSVGEELLWRGLFLEEFEDNVVWGAVWPLIGFALWHLAPQRILPSAQGRWTFTAFAGLVGAVSTLPAWRGQGLRGVLVPHFLTDACGVTAARFRLGR